MPNPQDARPRARSPFAAAFLSLIFPGLGHLYAGAPLRALGFAAAPVLLIALGAGTLLRMDRIELVGLVFSPFILTSVLDRQHHRPRSTESSPSSMPIGWRNS
ncbi:MAG: hypothetical protein WKF78_15620 [Candidatus Limnocylindrales bacterium]